MPSYQWPDDVPEDVRRWVLQQYDARDVAYWIATYDRGVEDSDHDRRRRMIDKVRQETGHAGPSRS
jgi:hypothetical protein